MKRSVLMVLLFISLICLSGCQGGTKMKDGYYTAQAETYISGWREFVTITVKQNEIIGVEYNAENESGYLKSWDNSYMKLMKASQDTYPNQYTRNYASQLLKNQNADDIDAMSGATHSHKIFTVLAKTAIEQSIIGDSRLTVISIPE